MKNINYVINGVLAVAVIILFVMQFSNKKDSPSAKTFAQSDDPVNVLPVAYVNLDSLLLNYNYAKDLYETQIRNQENARLTVTQQMRALEKDVQEFQRKAENNAFLSRERAQQEEQRIVKKQQELQELNDRLTNELLQEQQRTDEILRDTLISQLKVYNYDKKYQVILNGGSLLLADDVYDITTEVVEVLNKNYSSGK